MNRKRNNKTESKSLKAFFVYGFIVLILIVISLILKTYNIYKLNRFTESNITISVIYNNDTKLLIGIDNKRDKISVLDQGSQNQIEILTDAEIIFLNDKNLRNPRSIFWYAIYSPGNVKTDLTIIDLFRLVTSAKVGDFNIDDIYYYDNKNSIREKDSFIVELFGDNQIIDDGETIQIVNSTDIAGLGQKIERLVINKGGTVISVINQEDRLNKSIINNYSDKDYTAKKLGKLLNIPIQISSSKSIADVVIILGEDMN